MTEAAGRAALRRIMEQMRADPNVLDGVVSGVRADSAPVAALPVAEVRRHIAALLGVVSAAFIDSSGLGVQAADRLATDRALQGVPLAALLEGFQSGRAQVLRLLGERIRDRGVAAEDFVDALLELDDHANSLQNRIVEVYRTTELGLARTAHAARVQALRELLKGGAPSCVTDAGLFDERRYHCVVADVSDPRQARRIESVLTEAACALVDGSVCGVTSRLPDLTPVDDLLIVVAPPVTPRELAEAYQVCRAGIATARQRGLRGSQRLADLTVELAMDAHPVLGRMLADEHLYRLAEDDEFHRVLVVTALAYLDNGGRIDATAVVLHVHPNTVKHRLRRLGELTGFTAPDHSLADTLRWRWALDTWLSAGSTP